ncbi:MAG TPA: hypothetical protein VK539_03490 [Myxococcaceae bacterium]|nr:hypothetical protein [Myxococcaceae bacterium]
MKKLLVLLTALSLTLAACKTMEPRPETPPPAGGGTAPPAPSPPPTQTIPETGTVPTVPQSTEIIVGYCPTTGQYVATGVNTVTHQFTFTWRGGRATQPAAFARFYEARVPVTVYTSPVRLAGGVDPAPPPSPSPTGGASALAPAPVPTPQEPALGPAPVPTPPPLPGEGDAGGDPTFDPCQTISEDPPPSPKPTGGKAEPTRPTTFQSLAWRTAYAVDAVSDPVAPSTEPVPVPR